MDKDTEGGESTTSQICNFEKEELLKIFFKNISKLKAGHQVYNYLSTGMPFFSGEKHLLSIPVLWLTAGSIINLSLA